ncbi:DMT family transporter [Gemmobacter serpentinus]|uniref:DMT family transporter n=1 Tax=Gemmobacter serpentinus TaxID=2652247 RepID=UPI00124C2955|nr:multidrug efflux SMR transporter [Gemmobacter serpentinus]
MTQPVTYAILAVAIAFEVAGTTLLAQSAQFTRVLPTTGMAICYGIAFYCLSLLTGALPVGIIYALWSGLGIVFIAAINFVIFRQSLDLWAMVGLGLIILGVVVINTLSKSVAH